MPSFFKNITIDDVGYVKLPVGDTSQRPSNTQNGQMRFNSDRGIPEFRDNAQAEWKRQNQPTQVVATGGDAVYDIAQFGKKYRVHVFTQDGTFSVSKGGEVEYLVVAGGGGGGDRFFGGGGGAGGVVLGSTSVLTQSYNITIGAGGTAAEDSPGSNGGDSSAIGFTALGGGGGGGGNTPVGGSDGGCGGGDCRGADSTGTFGTGLQPTSASGGFGNDGGDTAASNSDAGGGGGGAGAPGESIGTSQIGGDGGAGISSDISGTSQFYGGGGGAVGRNGAGLGGLGGGQDGSGAGGDFQNTATPNSGGGGGGDVERNGGDGSGGSGIVVARYEIRDQEQLPPAEQDITEGLVLDLDFAKPTVYNGSGSTVSDSRLFPIEGSINGASYVNARTHRAAFEFDGSGDYIEIDYNNISNSTFMFWAVLPASGEQQIFSIGNSSSSAIGLTFNSTRNNFIQLVASSLDHGSSGDTGTFGVSSGLTTGLYYHFTLTTNSSGQLTNLYLNGVAQASQSDTSRVYNVENLTRLGERSDSNYAYTGPISFYRAYQKVLSSTEIAQVFNLTRWRFGV